MRGCLTMPSPSNTSRLARWRNFLLGVAVGLACLLAVGVALAQPDPDPFDALLRAHVKDGLVEYPGFQDSAAFRKYVEDLGKPARLGSRDETLAYYINAYNALAIQGILDGLSPASLLGRARYFKLKEWPLNGQSITLHDLEHKLIRPLAEPRIHFAIVCASKSCPLVRPEAYSAAKLEGQLDEQARRFVNDPVRNRFDPGKRTAHLSEIFKWFDEDFRGPAGSPQKYIAKYAADPEAVKLLAADGFKVEWIDYDWSLNGTPPRK